jgi:hypothetical protein
MDTADSQFLDFLYFQNQWNRRGERQVSGWRENMVDIYETHGVGDRSKLPSGGIGPNQLHSIPDNISHAANGEGRRRHLEERFPTSDIRRDDRAIEERRTEVENTRNEKINREKEIEEESSDDLRKYAVGEELPENDQLYHAVTENLDYLPPTSWESNTWGPAVANKEQVPFKRKQMTKSTRPRWRTISVPRLVRETRTVWDNAKTERQDMIEHIVWEEVVELDENDAPILDKDAAAIDIFEKPAYQPQGVVTETHKKSGLYQARKEAYRTRPSDKHPRKGPDEMSVAGDEEGDETQLFGDDVSEEDTDLFHLSYNNRLDPDGNIPGVKKPGSGKKDPKPPKPGENDGGSDDDSDDDNPKPDYGLVKPKSAKPTSAKPTSAKPTSAKPKSLKIRPTKPEPIIPNYTLSVGKGKDKGFRIAECTHKFSEDVTITQRDRVPLQNDSGVDQFDAKGRLSREIIPKNILISKGRKKEHKDMTWRWNQAEGILQLGGSNINWRPVLVLGKFNTGTGNCEDHHSFIELVQDIVDQNFSDESVLRYNKIVQQWYTRNDTAALKKKGQSQPRWTKEEHMRLLRDLNHIAFKKGLRWLHENWKKTENSVINQVKRRNDDYRRNTLKVPKRGTDAMRGKIRRSKKAVAKVDALKDAPKELLDSRPSEFFTIDDIDRLNEAKDGEEGEEEKEDEAEGEAYDDLEDDSEDDPEDEAEGVAKRVVGDELYEIEEPPKKKRKL